MRDLMCQSISLKVFSKNEEEKLIRLKSLALTWELKPAFGMNVTARLPEYIPVLRNWHGWVPASCMKP